MFAQLFDWPNDQSKLVLYSHLKLWTANFLFLQVLFSHRICRVRCSKWTIMLSYLTAHSCVHRDTHQMRIQSGLSRSHKSTWNPMRIECTLCPMHFGRWIESGLKLSCIITRDLCEVTPTTRSLLARWLVMACGECCIAIFCSALAAMLGEKGLFFNGWEVVQCSKIK